MLGTRKYPPAEPGALGRGPLKAAVETLAPAHQRPMTCQSCAYVSFFGSGNLWHLCGGPKPNRSLTCPSLDFLSCAWPLTKGNPRWTATAAEPGRLPLTLASTDRDLADLHGELSDLTLTPSSSPA